MALLKKQSPESEPEASTAISPRLIARPAEIAASGETYDAARYKIYYSEKAFIYMPRRIKRYANRKLYDTEAGNYVSLKDVAELVRQGKRVHVIDNDTGEDLTQQTLTQIILEEGREGQAMIPTEVLHTLLRQGYHAVDTGWERLERLSEGAGSLVHRSLGRLNRLVQGDRPSSAEMDNLKEQVERLDQLLQRLLNEQEQGTPPSE